MVVVDSPGSPAEGPTKLRSLLASFDLGRSVQWALLLIRMGRPPVPGPIFLWQNGVKAGRMLLAALASPYSSLFCGDADSGSHRRA